MRFLLDTHTFLWWDAEPDRLTDRVRDLLLAEENTLILSIASVWEMQIKWQTGKLNLRLPLSSLITDQQQNTGLQLLSIDLSHVYTLQQLPDVHRDPFDRIMVAQSIVEGLAFVSVDEMFDRYSVQRV